MSQFYNSFFQQLYNIDNKALILSIIIIFIAYFYIFYAYNYKRIKFFSLYFNAVRACVKKESDANAWNNRGLALSALEKYKRAVKAYDKAIKISPKHADAWNNKGLALSALKNYDGAIRAYDKAIEISPQYADAWNNKGLALFALENYEEAIKAYDKAIEISPKYADAWNNKGFTHSALENYEGAIRAYDKAIEINPQHADAWNNKGKSCYDLEKYDEAITAFNKAVEIDPNNVYTFYTPHVGMGVFNNPFLRWARKVYENKILGEFKDKIDIFSKLESISDEGKNRIRSRVAKATGQVIAFDAWETVIEESVDKLLFIIILTPIFSIIISLIFWFPTERNNSELSLLIGIILMSTLLILILTFLFLNLIEFFNYGHHMLKFVFILLVLYTLIANELRFLDFVWLPRVVQDGFGASLIGIVSFLGIFTILFGISSLLVDLIQRKKYHQYPDAEVINSLCISLNLAETDEWVEFNLKRKLLSRLELIAKRLENELPISLHSYDSCTDVWMSNCSKEMATGIRQMKKVVLLPKEGSQKHLTEVLAMRLLNASDGYWDLFEREKPSNTPTRVMQVFNMLRTIIGIGLPLFIVGIIIISPIDISETVMGYMAAVSIIWVGFNILVLFDPQYQEKMAAIKDMPENILGRRKS